MKQSRLYRQLAINAQVTAAQIRTEDELFAGNHSDQWRIVGQQQTAHLYALARERVELSHGWEKVEP